ncbi:hypothetical protein COHA_003516 [Chlorella ohadii]|uniref:Sulfotransferase n=1 Tax=Chlorella ohadii TaxID=2649997 RepID=A0AAD5DUK4_9CHLO|nr:hypothetical protein COHA_003516 [Chlorella ohadii]
MVSGGQASPSWQPQQQDSRLEVLRGCTSFACLGAAHALPHSPGERFNFPHFFILGFGKSATMSLAAYLGAHPQAVNPTPKEPWFFTRHGDCIHPNSSALWGCDQQAQQRYLVGTLHLDVVVASGLTRAAFEASPDYILASAAVVAGIWRELPWLKVVVSMRDPISQKMSAIVHWGAAALMYVVNSLYDRHPPSPFCAQFENLTANPAAVLADLKRFVGLDPALAPGELPRVNIRKSKYRADGWPMKRREYEHILSLA